MLRNFNGLTGWKLAATDGEIGTVREVYFDDQHWKIRYFLVTTGSWLFGREVLIAPRVITGLDESGKALVVNLTQEEVRQSPPVESDKPVSRQYEESMHKYYGWDPYWSFNNPGIGYGMPFGPGVIMPTGLVDQTESPITSHLRSSGELRGYQIQATDDELGKVEDFLFDDQSWDIRYLVVRPGGWTTQTHVLLSPKWIERVSFEASDVVVSLSSKQIKSAPLYDPAVEIDRDYEDRLHLHYERDAYWTPKPK